MHNVSSSSTATDAQKMAKKSRTPYWSYVLIMLSLFLIGSRYYLLQETQREAELLTAEEREHDEPYHIMQQVKEASVMTSDPGNQPCDCLDPDTKQHFNFCYRFNTTLHGDRMSCDSLKYLKRLNLLYTKYTGSDMKLKVDRNPPILTGASSNHFKELRHGIATAQIKFPDTRLIVYDFGLSQRELDELKFYCKIEIRKFDFEPWPLSVRRMFNYKWKPILLSQSIQEFPNGFWWVDSSIRWANNKTDHIYKAIERFKKSPYVLVDFAGHSIFAATNPKMYKYLPTDLDKSKHLSMYGGGFAFLVRTKLTMDVLKWLVLCAFQDGCMAAAGAGIGCRFGPSRWHQYAHCHRFDQSAINLLLAAKFNFQDGAYTCGEHVGFARVIRGTTGAEPLLCDETGQYVEAESVFGRSSGATELPIGQVSSANDEQAIAAPTETVKLYDNKRT